MVALLLTLLFYSLMGLIVWGRVPQPARLLAWGSLPIVWVSVLALAGLLETLFSIPAFISLPALFCRLIWFVFQHRGKFKSISFVFPPVTFWILFAFFLGEFLIAAQVHQRVPWGSWDPMFTWITRARFLVDGGDLWTQGFSNDLALLHPDYPPLFSWALVPLWSLDGSQSSLAVASLTIPFFAGWMLILIGWWHCVNNRNSLCRFFTLALILGTPFLIYLHAVKSLDFMVSYAILSSLAWYQFAEKEQNRNGWAICAFVVTWTALIKNEGQLWMVSFFGALLLLQLLSVFRNAPETKNTPRFSQRSILGAILQGALIPLCFLIWFKASLAPPNDLIEPQRAFEISQVLQPEVFFNSFPLLVRLDQAEDGQRHQLIWDQFWNEMWAWKTEGILLWAIPVLLAVTLLRRKNPFPWMLLAIGLQLAGYYCVYLLTPYNPYWHVSTSMNRLLIHVAPAALCLLGFAFSAAPVNSKKSPTEFFRSEGLLRNAMLSLSLLTLLFCEAQIRNNTFPWDFPNESLTTEEQQLSAIHFPRVSQATFVTKQFDPAALYRLQFATVPTVLVVDRREQIMLARFPSERELKAYCAQNGWDLKQHQGGFGWAESTNPDGPLPHMEQIRAQYQ
tara:strand:+ start:120265 stop:122124 length:1860 start_codon:yes stop_codon:yes gene_type:complete